MSVLVVVVDFDGVAYLRVARCGGGAIVRGENVDAGFGTGLEGEEGADADGYLDVGCHVGLDVDGMLSRFLV